MASPNLTEIVTTTLRNRAPEIADNVTNHNALLRRLKEKGHIKHLDGGRTIVLPLEYAENSTSKWYSGYELLDVAPSNVIDAAEYNWKQYSVNVTISGLEGDVQNAGKEKIIPLLTSRINNAQKTAANAISSSLYSDGTGSNSKEIGGLQHLIADDPSTGTVGGISRDSYTFWANINYDPTADGGTAANTTNIQSYMNQLWVQTVRGADYPDMVAADNTYWRLYLESLQAIQRIQNDKMAQAGFMNLKYMNADVFFDSGGGCPASHMYFVNTDYLYLCVHKNRDMVPLENKTAVNQDALVVPLVWAGNAAVSNQARQGVLTDS